MMKISIVKYIDFRHEEASNRESERGISLRIIDPGAVAPLSPAIYRVLTPADARKLASELINAADAIDAVRVSV